MVKGRSVVLEIVQANFQAKHRITHILRTLKIPVPPITVIIIGNPVKLPADVNSSNNSYCHFG